MYDNVRLAATPSCFSTLLGIQYFPTMYLIHRLIAPREQVHRCSQYNYAFTMKTFVIVNGVVTLVEYIVNANAQLV